ncbi:MAG: peptidoglycan editing factor PgeF [Acetivibrionales bacterium]
MGTLLDNRHIETTKQYKRPIISIPALSAFPELIHGFTTRFGGVSTGEYASFNLNFNRLDPVTNVRKNYDILSNELGVPLENMVLSHQVHDKNVLIVRKEHKGMGIVRERSYKSIDGLITQETGLMLVTYYADCVPVYFYDPVKKVIALSHSGWRGTFHNIAGETLRTMVESFGCSPGNIYISFGPHIKKCCFEVDRDVSDSFLSAYSWAEKFMAQRKDRKWNIDLEGIIAHNLIIRGINKEKISGCRVCTKCNNDTFFSHRGCKNQTGTGAAFLMIRG